MPRHSSAPIPQEGPGQVPARNRRIPRHSRRLGLRCRDRRRAGGAEGHGQGFGSPTAPAQEPWAGRSAEDEDLLENAEQDRQPADRPDVRHPVPPRARCTTAPTCRRARTSKLNAVGPAASPGGSSGRGSGDATYADTTISHPKITVVDRQRHRSTSSRYVKNDPRARPVAGGRQDQQARQEPYSCAWTVTLVLQVVASIAIRAGVLNVTAGKGTWLETTSCGPRPLAIRRLHGCDTGGFPSKFPASIGFRPR